MRRSLAGKTPNLAAAATLLCHRSKMTMATESPWPWRGGKWSASADRWASELSERLNSCSQAFRILKGRNQTPFGHRCP